MNSPRINTHGLISRELCGTPLETGEGYALVTLDPTETMRTDETGLIHGGFLFGMADYAAMLAVNHPNVVLAGADVRFLKPVLAGERLTAAGKITSSGGKKRTVLVEVFREGEKVFSGEFTCVIPEKHVTDKNGD